MKILIICHELSPVRGSECAVGWNICHELANSNEVTVLYALTNQFSTANYKNEIEQFLINDLEGNPCLKLIPISQPFFSRFFAKLNKLFSSKIVSIGIKPFFFIGIFFWELKAFFVAKKMIKFEDYKLLHKLSPISFRSPGFWPFLNIPVIYGPTSGIANIPVGFYSNLSFNVVLSDFFRRISNYYTMNFSILEYFKRKFISGIIVITNSDENYYKNSVKSILKVPEVGCMDNMNFDNHPKSGILKFIAIGRFDELKAYDILFQSLMFLDYPYDLLIIGNGPTKDLILNKYSLFIKERSIKFVDLMARHEVFENLANADLLIHTSIKEATASVIMESLSVGTPVLCHDSFSPQYIIDDSCGYKVKYESYKISIQGFSDNLKQITNNRELLKSKRNGAIAKAREFSWNNLGEKINLFYLKIVDESINRT